MSDARPIRPALSPAEAALRRHPLAERYDGAMMQKAIAVELSRRNDGLENVYTGMLQDNVDWRLATGVKIRARLPQVWIDELYRTDWIAKRLCNEAAEDAVRRWIEIHGDFPEPKGSRSDLADDDDEAEEAEDVGKIVLRRLEKIGVRETYAKAVMRDRKDGGSLIILQVDDGGSGPESLALPIDRTKIRTVTGLQLVDRWSVTPGPHEMEPKSRNFDRPAYYDIIPILGRSYRVHADRTIALRGVEVNDRTIYETNGWGESLVDMCWEPIRRFRSVWDSVEGTVKNFNQTVLKMKGMKEQMLAGNEEKVRARMRLFQSFRSTFKATPIDSDDSLEEIPIHYEGAATIIVAAGEELAAATGMPLSKLFGHSPQGFSTDDAPGEQQWANLVGAIQQTKIRPGLDYLLELLFLSSDGPTAGVMPDHWEVNFRPIHEPNDAEIADRRVKESQSDAILLVNQVITPREARSRLESDPRCPYQLEDESPTPELDPKDLLLPVPPTPGPPTDGSAVQDTALNGAQGTTLLETLKAVGTRQVDRNSGVVALELMFRISPADAERLMGNTGKSFFVETSEKPPTPEKTPPPVDPR